jgi:hypothetical protein
MAMAMRVNREAHLEAGPLTALGFSILDRPRPFSQVSHMIFSPGARRSGSYEPALLTYFARMMALIFALAGSITASSGWPRPVSGIEFA